jgi:hypothetical protein
MSAAVAALALASGCLDYQFRVVKPESTKEVKRAVAAAKPTPVDILFVVDNSGSMADEQMNLARNFDKFINVLTQGAGNDYQIAVVSTDVADVPAGVIFCLRCESQAAGATAAEGYPLAPHYLVHVGEDGTVLLTHTQAKKILDRLKRSCVNRQTIDSAAVDRFDRVTKAGADMRLAQKQLAAAVAAILGRAEEKAVESLFSPGGTQAARGEFAGLAPAAFHPPACFHNVQF